jgi:hypothetical protein
LNDDRIAEIFAREVLGYLVRKELLSPEWAERILSWRHTGFSVHSRVRAKTKSETERVGKYMIRPVLALERLSFLEPEGKVGYRYGQDRAEQEMMDYLEFIARVTSHIPDKGQVFVRYYGLYTNAHRGKVRKASVSPLVLRMAEEELKPVPSKGWAAMIRKVYEIDPMLCPKCGGQMKVIAFITDYQAVEPHHRTPQASVCSGEAAAVACLRAGRLDGGRGGGGVFLMTGYLMRSGRSRVFRAISWAFDMKIQPEDLLCGNFFILDIDPRPEL